MATSPTNQICSKDSFSRPVDPFEFMFTCSVLLANGPCAVPPHNISHPFDLQHHFERNNIAAESIPSCVSSTIEQRAFKMKLSFAPLLLLSMIEAFVPGWTSAVNRRQVAFQPFRESADKPAPSHVILFAKKKVNAKLAALEALEALESQVDPLQAPLSLKEMQELEKKKKKVEKVAPAADASSASVGGKKNAKAAALAALDGLEDEHDQPLSKKEQKSILKNQLGKPDKVEVDEPATAEPKQTKLNAKEEKLRKMMAMEEMDSARKDAAPPDEQSALSKKELKALMKKEEKMAAKEASKAEKKAQRAHELDDAMDEDSAFKNVHGDDRDGEGSDLDDVDPEGPTLEDKIRKERPPPRVRVMESAQPGFVSLRLEKVGITFRNQQVLKDVTWGVQSGDRIG